ncbi:flagellar export protein FliJ [Campylobacter sp. MIT 97-5078]|uniref:flagellar export protein FliJ n=1 Tax=Campylobacter sp. MIT 97-5078 TaxID=1548153 RepID=UPI000512A2D3|nr:flagellar export protein FliJ [Campylobacter sp. MIT 97-5078]KGI55361.1 hypothetical protein LR59_12385 [Campylobacter sp. MIT 97-5078]KGI57582.1 hypothetical protein LR59_02525 [Campylobacter sp. MIT 97-5078]KGI57720.1 hypothetical protein LR59_03285 [Campylobacter sp. MIT 97-5078]TQR26659.1 hypothetical protein DMB91_07040 [Campylobacter sp. MIT 97-5078]
MKNKYSSILKVKKQGLDKAEQNLSQAKQRQLQNKLAFQNASLEYANFALPQNGSTQILKQNLEMLKIAKNVKERAKEKLELSQKEVLHYQTLYKRASLDYEKIKYLQSEEFKAMQKHLKKEEEKFLDEIAISRHFYGAKDE